MDVAVMELLVSRICHDLISPVGAVHNGIEFLEEMGPEAGADAISLIAHSAKQASARLQIFRLTYGAGGLDPNLKPKDIRETFAKLIEIDGKVTQEWSDGALAADDLPKGFCKILLGVMVLAMEALPKGGAVAVDRSGDQVTFTATGENAAPRPQTQEALSHSLAVETLDPRLVHPYALSLMAKEYGFNLSLADQKDGQVTYSLTL